MLPAEIGITGPLATAGGGVAGGSVLAEGGSLAGGTALTGGGTLAGGSTIAGSGGFVAGTAELAGTGLNIIRVTGVAGGLYLLDKYLFQGEQTTSQPLYQPIQPIAVPALPPSPANEPVIQPPLSTPYPTPADKGSGIHSNPIIESDSDGIHSTPINIPDPSSNILISENHGVNSSTAGANSGPRTFVTSDPGVGPLIDAIEAYAPGTVKQAEIKIYRPDGTTYTDFDIVTDSYVIQVKTGGGKGIVGQIQTSQQLTDLPVIGYDANSLIGSKQSFGPEVMKNANKQGITIVNNVNDLLKIIIKK